MSAVLQHLGWAFVFAFPRALCVIAWSFRSVRLRKSCGDPPHLESRLRYTSEIRSTPEGQDGAQRNSSNMASKHIIAYRICFRDQFRRYCTSHAALATSSPRSVERACSVTEIHRSVAIGLFPGFLLAHTALSWRNSRLERLRVSDGATYCFGFLLDICVRCQDRFDKW